MCLFSNIEAISVTFESPLRQHIPDSKVHGDNMWPIWGRQDPDWPHVGPMNFAIWDISMVLTRYPGILRCQRQEVNELLTRYRYFTLKSNLFQWKWKKTCRIVFRYNFHRHKKGSHSEVMTMKIGRSLSTISLVFLVLMNIAKYYYFH